MRVKPSKRKEKLEEDANSNWKDQPVCPKGVYPLGFVNSTQKFHKKFKVENNCPPFLNLVSKTSRRIPLKDHVDPLFPDSSGGNWAFFGQMRHISDPRHFCLDFSGQSIPIGNQQTIGLGFSPRKIGIFTLLVF